MRSNLTLDYGLRISHFQPTYDKEERLAIFDPDLYDPARAVRLYQPVCVGSPCVRRAIDPAVDGSAHAREHAGRDLHRRRSCRTRATR